MPSPRFKVLGALLTLALVGDSPLEQQRSGSLQSGRARTARVQGAWESVSVGLPPGCATPPADASSPESRAAAPRGPAGAHGKNHGEIRLSQDPANRPVWAVRFDSEFWRLPSSASPARSLSQSVGTSASLVRPGDVIDRVSHAFGGDPSGSGMRVEGGAYRAMLRADGLHFAPAHPGVGVPQTDSAAGEPGSWGDEVRFRTVYVQRGDRQHFSAPGEPVDWHVLGNTAQTLLEPASGLVEHHEARQAGIEVTWLVPRPLEGDGDLVVQAELTGLRSSRQTPSGVHFSDASGLARVRVGPAEAVDQSGRRWRVSTRVAGDLLSVEVPSQVLAQASFPLAIDPLISAEFGLDQPVEGPSPCTRAAPALAAGDSGYLVVWTHGKGDLTSPAVYGARLDATGSLLDPYGILISPSAAEQTVCAVAANPSGFLAVWSAPHGTSTTDWDILGARILTDGTVLDSSPLPVCALTGSLQNSPAVAANGDNNLVVWRDSRSTGIYGTPVASDGTIAATNGLPICTAAKDQFTPAVAALGQDYLVVWQDYRNASSSQYQSDIYGARITGGGVLIDTNGIALCTRTNSQYHPAVAASGTQYLVVWEDYDREGNDIYGARVDAEGDVLDPDGLVLGRAANTQANPVVAATDRAFLVAWQDYRGTSTNAFAASVFGTRVNDVGWVMDPDGLALSTAPASHGSPAVAARGDEAVVVWQDFRNNPATTLADIYGARVASISNAVVQPNFALARPANGEVSPAVAANGTNSLVVWVDNRNGSSTGLDILGARVSQDGALLDASAIPICTATNRQADPAVAANGTDYLVVWSDGRDTPANANHADIYGSRVSAAGWVMEPDGLAICTATNDQSLPAVAAFGTNFLVVWQDGRNSTLTPPRPDIYGARVASDGTVLDPAGLALCTHTASQTAPAVAVNGPQALVVWTDLRNGPASDIYGARVRDDGFVIETNGIEICRASNLQSAPAVAANGAEYLVIWADARSGAANVDIYGATVTTQGFAWPTDGFPIRTVPGQQTAPAVVAQGPDYLVVWQEARSGASNSCDILGVRVGSGGTGLGVMPFLIDTNVFDQLAPAVAGGSSGPCLVVSQGFGYAAPRTVANLFHQQALPSLDSGIRLADGHFQFRLRGAPAFRYQVEASEDARTWTPLRSTTLTNDSVLITDPAAPTLPWRFYRALLLP